MEESILLGISPPNTAKAEETPAGTTQLSWSDMSDIQENQDWGLSFFPGDLEILFSGLTVSILEIDDLTVLNELANSDPVAVLRGSIVDVENPERLESHRLQKPNIDDSMRSSTSFGYGFWSWIEW